MSFILPKTEVGANLHLRTKHGKGVDVHLISESIPTRTYFTIIFFQNLLQIHGL